MIGSIENAIVARILAAQTSGVLGYELKKITSYAGDLSEGLKSVVRVLPAVWVVFSGARPEKVFHRTLYEVSGRFSVIVAANALRNEQEARHGAASAPGAYQILEDMIALLAGKTMGMQISPLAFEGIEALYNDRTDQTLAAIYGISLSTRWQVDAGEDTSGLSDFETFHADWDVPAHGGIGPVLPDDAHADASDTVTLET